ncbi:B-cell receptor CD22-like isoform X2, partial [Clarias magur]
MVYSSSLKIPGAILHFSFIDFAVMVSLWFVPRPHPASLLFLLVMIVFASQRDLPLYYPKTSICALKGSTVTMVCRYAEDFLNKDENIFWSKVASPYYAAPDLSLDPEYTGRVQYAKDSWYEYKLRLSNVTKQDQRKYYAVIRQMNWNMFKSRGGVNLSVTELQVEVYPHSVVEGKLVMLMCTTTCNLTDTPDFTWYKHGRELYSRHNSKLLILPSVRQEDAGSYSCGVRGQSYISPAVRLNVYYPPKSVSVSISPSGEIVEGSSVILICNSDANPPVETYIWYKQRSYIGTGKTYTISTISSADSGDYTCQAENKHGHQSSTAVSLNVLYPPKKVAVSVSPSGEIVEGSTVTLTCSSHSETPGQIYTWYKESSFISIGRSYIINWISSKESGEYKCMVENQYGEQTSDGVTLNIVVPPKRVSVDISPSGEIVEGSTVTLKCSSDATPPVEMTWFKGTSHIATAEIYFIPKIQSDDNGDYKCKSSNQYGWKYSKKVTVKVVYPPKRVSVSISPSGKIMEDSTVTLTCRSDANPPVKTYTWYKGKSSIGTGKTYTISRIRSEDSGDYRCKSSNKYGEKYSNVTLNVLHSIGPSSETLKSGSVAPTLSSNGTPPVKTNNWSLSLGPVIAVCGVCVVGAIIAGILCV